jgi:hypothetical protein
MLPRRQMAVPKTLEARLEIIKAVHALMGLNGEQSYARKFDPDQPRVPAGNPDGGQWTSEGGSGGSATSSSHVVLAARSKQSEAECEAQYAQDSFICRAVRTRLCWEQAAQRLAACLSGRQLPPLNF